MFCNNCGAQVPDSAKFCTHCGFRFPTNADAPADAPVQNPIPASQMFNAPPAAPAQEPIPASQTYDAPPVPPVPDPVPASQTFNAAPAQNPIPASQGYNQPPAAPAYAPNAPVYAPPVPPVYAAPPAYAGGVPARAPEGPKPGHTVLHALGKSPLALIAIIAFTLASILAIVQSILSQETISDFSRNLLELMDADRDVTNAFDISLGASTWSSIAASVVTSGLLIAGMWITWSTVRRSDNRMTTSGLTMIRVIETIELVFVCIGCGVALLAALAGGVGISSALKEASGSSNSDMPDFVRFFLENYFLFVLVLACFLTLSILYYAGIVRTVKRMRATVKTGEPNHKVSVFVAIVNMILAVSTVLRVSLTGLVLEAAETALEKQEAPKEVLALLSFGEIGAVGAAQSVLMAVALFCFGLFLFRYRNAMRAAQQAN